MIRSLARLLGLFILGASPLRAEIPMTFWVWNHSAGVSSKEGDAFRKAHIACLYWHVADLRWQGNAWKVEGEMQPLPKVDAIEVVPVFRLHAEAESSKGDFSKLGKRLGDYARRFGSREIQIDYDCPDSELTQYANDLKGCRAELQHIRLTATALAGWIDHPAFKELELSVDGLSPMFYDLETDKPDDVQRNRFAPIADFNRDVYWIEKWGKCHVPWNAGLPCFARVSLFDASGGVIGHLRHWNWEALIFNPALRLTGASEGCAVLDVTRPDAIERTELRPGERIAVREPVRSELAALAKAAARVGAARIIWFRLSDGGSQTPFGIAMLRALANGSVPETQLRLAHDDKGRWILHNDGPADMLPRVAGRFGQNDRGWQLEVDADVRGVFRDASPGDFSQVAGFAEPENVDSFPVPVDQAKRLTFWFAGLPAGESLQTGVIPLDNSTHHEWKLRWRVDGGSWQSFE
jgi:hypothetical protein